MKLLLAVLLLGAGAVVAGKKTVPSKISQQNLLQRLLIIITMI
jgi:hypothetical protein